MKVISKKPIVLQKVKTDEGSTITVIRLSRSHILVEQNPKKESEFAEAYRKRKKKNIKMFWELKNDRYTGYVYILIKVPKNKALKTLKTLEGL